MCDLGRECYFVCDTLHRVTFGALSSLERIGAGAFSGGPMDIDSVCKIEEISIPDGVHELCDCTFFGCKSLRHVLS